MAEEETLPIVTFGNLMTEGTALSRRGQHDKALGCFNDVRAPRPEGTELHAAGGASGWGRRDGTRLGSGGGRGSGGTRGKRGRHGGTCPQKVSARGGDPDGVVQGQGSACSTENL